MKLKEEYILANCCRPKPEQKITGYYSHDGLIKVHRADCPNLDKTDPERLMTLAWKDIIEADDPVPGNDFKSLAENDFRILKHHRQYGVDYSLKVAAILHLDKQSVFDSHRKLRDMKLLERVKPLIIQYRKNIVDNKWIKHRNHTYYDLTDKGRLYLRHYLKSEE